MTDSIISLSEIEKYYGSGAGRQQVLFSVDLEIPKSALVSIVGTSGSGKSTLLNIIGGLDRNFKGKVHVDGNDYSRLSDKKISVLRNKSIGFIFQSFNLLDHLTCWENVALPGFFDRNPIKNPKKRAVEVLERVGLKSKVDAKPGNLSGGQKQRVAIARSLFNKPKILLCDEPTGNLDSKTGAQIIDLFRELNTDDGITLILVTHEDRLSRVAERVIRLEDGRIVDELKRDKVNPCDELEVKDEGDEDKDHEEDEDEGDESEAVDTEDNVKEASKEEKA